MSNLRVQAQLITAIVDLKVTRSIRNAVRVNTLKKGGREGLLGNIENPKPAPSLPNFGERRDGTVCPTAHAGQPRVEYRRAIESARRCECHGAAHVTHAPRGLPDLIPTDVTLPASDAERASGVPSRHPSPLVPPWQMPLPVVHASPPLIKWRASTSDLNRKGSLIDCFV